MSHRTKAYCEQCGCQGHITHHTKQGWRLDGDPDPKEICDHASVLRDRLMRSTEHAAELAQRLEVLEFALKWIEETPSPHRDPDGRDVFATCAKMIATEALEWLPVTSGAEEK